VADLAALQRQFYDRVTARESTDGLIASGDLEIYARMYATRLYDALAEDYPKLRAALDDDRFGALAARYLREHPPRSFTLRDFGLALPDLLRTAAGAAPGAPGGSLTAELAPPWAADLAALERARLEVFDGPDAEPLSHAEAVARGAELPELVLSWIPSSVVVPIAWAVDELWSAIEDEQPPFEPAPADRVVLVWRRDLAVLHRTLDPDEAGLALSLAAGVRFADICGALAELHGDGAVPRATELLIRWLAAGALAAPADPAAG
jgi:hypothetical protein